MSIDLPLVSGKVNTTYTTVATDTTAYIQNVNEYPRYSMNRGNSWHDANAPMNITAYVTPIPTALTSVVNTSLRRSITDATDIAVANEYKVIVTAGRNEKLITYICISKQKKYVPSVISMTVHINMGQTKRVILPIWSTTTVYSSAPPVIPIAVRIVPVYLSILARES